jgi:hypothetical protein
MEKGRITYEGRAEALRSNPRLVAELSMGGAHVEELVAFEEAPETHAAPSADSDGHLPAPAAASVVAPEAAAGIAAAPTGVVPPQGRPEEPAYAAPVASPLAEPGPSYAPAAQVPVTPAPAAYVAPDAPAAFAPPPTPAPAAEPTPLEPTPLEPTLFAPVAPAASAVAESPAQEGTA